MVNGLHLYSAFIQSALQFYASHSPIHTQTAIGCHVRYQPTCQEHRCLAQGHFGMPRVGSNPPTARRLLLPPEPSSPPWQLCQLLNSSLHFPGPPRLSLPSCIKSHSALLPLSEHWCLYTVPNFLSAFVYSKRQESCTLRYSPLLCFIDQPLFIEILETTLCTTTTLPNPCLVLFWFLVRLFFDFLFLPHPLNLCSSDLLAFDFCFILDYSFESQVALSGIWLPGFWHTLE